MVLVFWISSCIKIVSSPTVGCSSVFPSWIIKHNLWTALDCVTLQLLSETSEANWAKRSELGSAAPSPSRLPRSPNDLFVFVWRRNGWWTCTGWSHGARWRRRSWVCRNLRWVSPTRSSAKTTPACRAWARTNSSTCSLWTRWGAVSHGYISPSYHSDPIEVHNNHSFFI